MHFLGLTRHVGRVPHGHDGHGHHGRHGLCDHRGHHDHHGHHGLCDHRGHRGHHDHVQRMVHPHEILALTNHQYLKVLQRLRLMKALQLVFQEMSLGLYQTKTQH